MVCPACILAVVGVSFIASGIKNWRYNHGEKNKSKAEVQERKKV